MRRRKTKLLHTFCRPNALSKERSWGWLGMGYHTLDSASRRYSAESNWLCTIHQTLSKTLRNSVWCRPIWACTNASWRLVAESKVKCDDDRQADIESTVANNIPSYRWLSSFRSQGRKQNVYSRLFATSSLDLLIFMA